MLNFTFYYREQEENCNIRTLNKGRAKRASIWDSFFDFLGFPAKSLKRRPRKIADNDDHLRESKCKFSKTQMSVGRIGGLGYTVTTALAP